MGPIDAKTSHDIDIDGLYFVQIGLDRTQFSQQFDQRVVQPRSKETDKQTNKLSPNRMRNNYTFNQFSKNIGHHSDFFLAKTFSLLDGSEKIKPRKRKAEPFERIVFYQTYYLCVRGLWIPFNWENDQQAGSGEQAYNWLAPNSARGDLSEFTSHSNGNCLENFVAGERLTFPSERPFALM